MNRPEIFEPVFRFTAPDRILSRVADLGDYTDGRDDRRSDWHRRLDAFLLRGFPSPMRENVWEAAQAGWGPTLRYAWKIILFGLVAVVLLVILQMATSIGT